MARVVHFEIQADDPERAMEFYRRVRSTGVQETRTTALRLPPVGDPAGDRQKA